MFNVYFYGSLRILVDTDTGRVIGVQDRVSGIAAELRFSADYISRAKAYARQAWEATADASL